MAEETLDYIIKEKLLPFKKECGTKTYKIDGSNKPISLQNLEKFHINEKIKCSLIRLYGSKAIDILTLSCKENLSHTLHHHFDFIEAELIYSIRNEFVQKPNDFLIRRINLGRVNIKAAKEALSRVVELMSNELSWNNEETLHHYQEALGELNELL